MTIDLERIIKFIKKLTNYIIKMYLTTKILPCSFSI